MANKNPISVSYRTRWGHDRTRTLKGHPKREARKSRAYARGASKPGDAPNPYPSAMKAKRRA